MQGPIDAILEIMRERNVEAARNVGVAVENAIKKLKQKKAGEPQNFVSLTAINENGLQSRKSEAIA